MSRLVQLGVFTIVLGCVVFFLSLFPQAVDASGVAGIGLTQTLGMLAGLTLVIAGGYTAAYALLQHGRPVTLLRKVGIRMGLTGMVLSAAASLADTLGFGSHTGAGPLFGWLQAAGMMLGFGFAALGVLLYGISRS